MVRLVSGEWHCPSHGLMLAIKHLVSLYAVEHRTDSVAISTIIDHELPALIAKVGGASLLN